MSQRYRADLGRVGHGHSLEYSPRHALEYLTNEEDGEVFGEEGEEDEAGDGNESRYDGPSITPALTQDAGNLKQLTSFQPKGPVVSAMNSRGIYIPGDR